MATADSVKAKLQGLLDKANTATGNTDTDLTTAVGALIDGYGQGGGFSYDMGEFVLDEDVSFLATSKGAGIPHKLGKIPQCIMVWTDDFANLDENNLNPYNAHTNIGYMWFCGLTGMKQRLSSTINSDFGIFVASYLANGSFVNGTYIPSSGSYVMKEDNFPTTDIFGLSQIGNAQQQWRVGIKYKYFVSEAWWNVGGVANAE